MGIYFVAVILQSYLGSVQTLNASLFIAIIVIQDQKKDVC